MSCKKEIYFTKLRFIIHHIYSVIVTSTIVYETTSPNISIIYLFRISCSSMFAHGLASRYCNGLTPIEFLFLNGTSPCLCIIERMSFSSGEPSSQLRARALFLEQGILFNGSTFISLRARALFLG